MVAQSWVVLLEAAGGESPGGIDHGDVEKLLAALEPGRYGAALHSPDRYALQVGTTGSNPAEALRRVLSQWAGAVRRLELPSWPLVRTEVFTPEELERELEGTPCDEMPVPGWLPSPGHSGEDEDLGHELLRQAFSDPVTGLLTPEAFEHRLEAALTTAGADRSTAVVRIGLDSFAQLHDRSGDITGDHVLLAVAHRLAAILRRRDGLARLGGDQYAVLLEQTTNEAAAAVVDRMLDAVGRPVTVLGRELAISARAGIALSTPGEDARTLIGNAGAALAVARQAGGARRVMFRPAMSDAAPRRFPGNEALEDRLAHVVLMQGAAVVANDADTLRQAATAVIRQMCTHVGCAVGRLWLPPATAAGAKVPLWHMADAGDYREFQEASETLQSDPRADLPGRAVAEGRPVWMADLPAAVDWPRREHALAVGLESAFAVPVLVRREVVAVLEFFSRSRMEPTRSFIDVLASIGTQVGRVVERQRAADALRRAEEQLRASEAGLRAAQAMARADNWHFELRTGQRGWTDAMYGL